MEIVPGRADFLGARNLFRRNVRPDHALDNSATMFADQHSCGLKSALLNRNSHGHFEMMTTSWGFAARTGWRTSVAAGDFDGDGRLDLAVGNRGRNKIYELNQPGPLRVFYDDGSGGGPVKPIEACRNLHERRWSRPGSRIEQYDYGDLYPPSHPPWGTTTVRPYVRHGKGDNYSWVDGHVLLTSWNVMSNGANGKIDWFYMPTPFSIRNF